MNKLSLPLVIFLLATGCSSSSGVDSGSGDNGFTVLRDSGLRLSAEVTSADGEPDVDARLHICNPEREPDEPAVVEPGIFAERGTFTVNVENWTDLTGGLFLQGIVLYEYTVEYEGIRPNTPPLKSQTYKTTLALPNGIVSRSNIVELMDHTTIFEFAEQVFPVSDFNENILLVYNANGNRVVDARGNRVVITLSQGGNLTLVLTPITNIVAEGRDTFPLYNQRGQQQDEENRIEVNPGQYVSVLLDDAGNPLLDNLGEPVLVLVDDDGEMVLLNNNVTRIRARSILSGQYPESIYTYNVKVTYYGDDFTGDRFGVVAYTRLQLADFELCGG